MGPAVLEEALRDIFLWLLHFNLYLWHLYGFAQVFKFHRLYQSRAALCSIYNNSFGVVPTANFIFFPFHTAFTLTKSIA
jgi:hypothetical protein